MNVEFHNLVTSSIQTVYKIKELVGCGKSEKLMKNETKRRTILTQENLRELKVIDVNQFLTNESLESIDHLPKLTVHR